MEFRKFKRGGVEYRVDPLTQEQCRINPDRAMRIRQAGGEVDLGEIITRTRETCPFCPERINENTPGLPKKVCRVGRIKLGETLIFPNLNPVGENHAVGVISQVHFLAPDEFNVGMLRDNLTASKDYILSVYGSEKQAIWPIYIWNYMPPSAGSIIHPHSQILVEQEPLPIQAELSGRSEEYFNRNRRNYWEEWVKQEREVEERFIYDGDCLSVIASFAPRGFNEIQFIFREASSLTELDGKQISDFAGCLVKALKGYKELGIGSFNLVTYSGSIGEKVCHYNLNAKLISRPYPRGVYTNDTGPMERLYDVWVIDTLPEVVAETLKPFFN